MGICVLPLHQLEGQTNIMEDSGYLQISQDVVLIVYNVSQPCCDLLLRSSQDNTPHMNTHMSKCNSKYNHDAALMCHFQHCTERLRKLHTVFLGGGRGLNILAKKNNKNKAGVWMVWTLNLSSRVVLVSNANLWHLCSTFSGVFTVFPD